MVGEHGFTRTITQGKVLHTIVSDVQTPNIGHLGDKNAHHTPVGINMMVSWWTLKGPHWVFRLLLMEDVARVKKKEIEKAKLDCRP